MKKYVWDYALLFGIAGAIIALDQWTKALVRANLPFGEIWSPWPWLTPFARIVHWNNTGAAFGMGQGFGGVFGILAVIVSIGILYYYPQVPRSDWTLRIAMGMQMGGALGNLIDRLFFGGRVTDFISVGTFAVFNVADASITIGVVILILGVLVKEMKDRKARQLAGPAPEASLSDGEAQPGATVLGEGGSQTAEAPSTEADPADTGPAEVEDEQRG